MNGLGVGAIISLVIFLLFVGILLIFSVRQPSIIRIAIRNLRGLTKMNLALLSATCVSTIVITGSLIAGDSLRESITNAAYDNLSEVDEIVTSYRLFNASVLDGLSENENLMDEVDHLSPLIHMRGIVENPKTGSRTNTAYVIGFNHAFLDFGDMISVDGTKLDYSLGANEVYLNKNLADEVGLDKGDRVNISFSKIDQLFEAIFLGNQEKTNLKVQFVVKDVLKSESLGRFQLNANRNPPQNIYVPLDSLQKVLGTQDSVNMILVSNEGDEKEGVGSCDVVSKNLENALDDIVGYKDAGFSIIQNPEKGYIKLEASDVFFPYDYYEHLSSSSEIQDLDSASPIVTYFWNFLTLNNRSVPYSTVTAFDSDLDEKFGLFKVNGTSEEIKGELEKNEIILNSWTADRLEANINDVVSLNYSLMDEFYNIRYITEEFTIKYIVDMEGKANDSMLMPEFPGIEGKSTVLDWDPPFSVDLTRITDDDEQYWEDFKGTPKAFISLKAAAELWNTDIGNITQVRLQPTDSNLSALTFQVEDVLNDYVGMSEAALQIRRVKLDAINSAEGTDIFTGMFLAFSAACIIAAAVLIVLLITLRIESRRAEIGILRAIGFKIGAINHIFLIEGTILSIIGGFAGIIIGFLFGIFLIGGMNTFWSSIVEGSPVIFYFTPDSLVVGFTSGIIVAIITLIVALRFEGKKTVIGSIRQIPIRKEMKMEILLPALSLVLGLAILLSMPFLDMEIESQLGLFALGFGPLLIIYAISQLILVRLNRDINNWAGLAIVLYTVFLMFYFIEIASLLELFFLSGFMLLCGFLLMFYYSLMKVEMIATHEKEKVSLPSGKRWLFKLARKNVARRPTRTMFMMILFSLTLFVLVSLTINLQGALIDVERAVEESGGSYDIMGDSATPIFANLADESSRTSSNIQSQVFEELEVEQFKTKGDVGGTCSNLNRIASPRIIGANESFFVDNTFIFISNEDSNNEDNPWLLLEEPREDNEVPAIGDYNTIVWILGWDVGSTISVFDENGDSVNLKIVGIIGNSIFQGSLIIWDEYFDELYPTNNGYQLFLFNSQLEDLKPQITELESALTRYGFDAYTVESVVVENILIENTYISIFQVILMFGLIIGTLGFGIVASRNMLERRTEIGILRAIGFSKEMILKVLILENSYVILCAMIIGTLSGIIASSVYLIKMQLAITSWPWLYVFAILIISFVIAMTSALIPIFKTSKMSVTDSIRAYE
ncbi:MAG: FtsX-like permease family protein [Thermoplasmata archaeon]|nr:MAG: FtsX-like permease family protein [Thermoplasmata archaeon]